MRNIEIEQADLVEFKKPEKIVIPESTEEIWINNVFGINRNGELPARFLSGFISTFTLARLISDRSNGHLIPKVRIFRPVNISKFINGIPDDLAKRQISQGNDALDAFVGNNFPEIPFFIEEDEEVGEEALSVLARISEVISASSDISTIDRLREKGRRRGGREGSNQALVYAAHHPFGWSDLHQKSIFKMSPPSVVLNTMPPSEREFAEIRSMLKIAFEDNPDLVVNAEQGNLFINMCGTPHYILLESQDEAIQEPMLGESLGILCSELLSDLKMRRIGADSFMKENLRRARNDLEKLMLTFSGGDSKVLSDISFGSLINGGAR